MLWVVVVERRDIVVDGQRIAVFETGKGEPCLLLHGYPQSHLCWRKVVPALARSHRVIAVDWFGWGASERSCTDRPSYDRETKRVALLMDALDLEKVNLFAHDYGGLLALAFAVEHPERLRRLALLNTRAHRTFTPVWYVVFGAITWLARIPGVRWMLAQLPLYGAHKVGLGSSVANGSFSAQDLEESLGWLRHKEGRRWLLHFYRYFRVGARTELGTAAEKLTCPTAVIWGAQDPYFPVSTGEDLARRIPKSQWTLLPEASHYIMEERPEEVSNALLALLQTLPD